MPTGSGSANLHITTAALHMDDLSLMTATRSYGGFGPILTRSMLLFFRLAWQLHINFPSLYVMASVMLNICMQVQIELL